MSEHSEQLSRKAGLPPGTLVHVGKRTAENIKISVIDYDEKQFSEVVCKTSEEAVAFTKEKTISWINIDGLHETDAIAELGALFGLHPLLLEDVLNTRHRPKAEEFEEYLFLTLKMLGISKDGKSVISEQVSFVLGKDWVLSFQEREGDIFDNLRSRLREGKGAIRKRGADYLLYRLIDTVVDHYFFVTEHFSDASEKLEKRVLENTDQRHLHEIQRYKKQLIQLRKSIAPLREAVSTLQKEQNPFISEATSRYLRDVYEHIIQVNDSLESQRDVISSIMDLYLSGVSNKMNQVMQVLTIISTIFIPMTFVAGIYGMNFQHIPELEWEHGYLYAWILMLAVVVVMVIYFKRKKWL
jgi:magnesium transporter